MTEEWFKEGKDKRAALRFFVTLYQDRDKSTRRELIESSLGGFMEEYTYRKREIDKLFEHFFQ